MLATKVQEGLGSSSVDANINQMMSDLVTYLFILRSTPHPKRTPSLLSAAGNYISQSPLPAGLGSERHWGKAEVRSWREAGLVHPLSPPASGGAQVPLVAVSFDPSFCQMATPRQPYSSIQEDFPVVLAGRFWLLGFVTLPSHSCPLTLAVTVAPWQLISSLFGL